MITEYVDLENVKSFVKLDEKREGVATVLVVILDCNWRTHRFIASHSRCNSMVSLH